MTNITEGTYATLVAKFLASRPEIMDYYQGPDPRIPDDRRAQLVEFQPDSWDKECPEHDHDCAREGCGRTVCESGEFGVCVKVFNASTQHWVTVAEWWNRDPGGYGF